MIKGIEERRVILSFNDVSLMTDPVGRSGSVDVGLDLLGGELLMIRMERQQQGTVLGDACAGLALPPKGQVVFLGKEWSQLPPDIANALRGRIGRVFPRNFISARRP